jgi:beta-1,4-N-acetylglucosaminyltransferase
MAPPPSALYTPAFLLALLITLLVAGTLRLLAILPNRQFKPKPFRRQPVATRILIVLGSGGHTHEMFCLLRDLDTRKYTHRSYAVGSGDAFSSQRAVEFERELEERERQKSREKEESEVAEKATPEVQLNGKSKQKERAAVKERPACVGPEHYNITILPRARAIHQPLLTTPLTCLYTLFSALRLLLSSERSESPATPYEAAAQDLPDLIITNGPATGVIVVLGALILKFFGVRDCVGRGKLKTVYVESFARVSRLSLSGRLLVRCVDRFLVQWEELEGKGGRAEFLGVLV